MLWTKGGILLVDADGKPIECAECPCQGAEPVDCTFCLSRLSTDPLYVTYTYAGHTVSLPMPLRGATSYSAGWRVDYTSVGGAWEPCGAGGVKFFNAGFNRNNDFGCICESGTCPARFFMYYRDSSGIYRAPSYILNVPGSPISAPGGWEIWCSSGGVPGMLMLSASPLHLRVAFDIGAPTSGACYGASGDFVMEVTE